MISGLGQILINKKLKQEFDKIIVQRAQFQHMRSFIATFLQAPPYIGVIAASLFFSLSLTPSMIPRPFVLQGLLSGFAMIFGYGLGVACVALWHYMQLPALASRPRRVFHYISTTAVMVILSVSLFLSDKWQNDLRLVMELPEQEDGRIISMALIAIVLALVLLLLARCIKYLFFFIAGRLKRIIPPRITNVISAVIVVVIVVTLSNQFAVRNLVNTMDEIYAASDALTDTDARRPANPWQTGSDASLISWDSLGRRGQNFVSMGSTKAAIAAHFGDTDVRDPIRVYVGLRSAKTGERRAALALEELIRAGGFERSKLVVATPTGTGWHDPSGVDPFEFMHRGDTAMVTVQYSYLPSWLTLLLDPTRVRVDSRRLFQEIYQYWATLPKDERPELYIYGLSLGALGAETSIEIASLLRDPIQGGVFAGTPFPSTYAPTLMRSRKPGSPQWQPVVEDSSFIRFTAQENALDIPGAKWGRVRLVYIQYASDPMVFFTPDMYFREPDWIRSERGPDISPDLKWFPVVTFLQVMFDLPMADKVPKGVGHNYSASSYIDAWVAVSDPVHWSDAQTKRLKVYFQGR
ncbi:MAG: alpha/beta-hydrolase family protein [Desulfobacterales bacterium]|nr:alpha/beta-hydrolase family protein [Desulfobacterales bacterium]